MLIDRYDKNGKQIRLGDYLLYKDKYPYKVVYDEYLLAFGVVDADSEFEFMSDWVKEDWTISTYQEIFGN